MKLIISTILNSLLLCAMIVSAGSGCATYHDQYARRDVGEREDILLVREEIRRLAGRIEGLELEMGQLQRDQDEQRADFRQFSRSQAENIEQRLASLESRVRDVDGARQKDKQEIIDHLSKTIEQLVASRQTARQSQSARTTHSGYGYEHEVGAGETLSHIAAAYGVTTRTIVEANDLQNPDRLRIGQTLFIPE